MSNKKQVKKETPILLGIPDGEIELDNDAYITKLGGLPVWSILLLVQAFCLLTWLQIDLVRS